MSLSQQLVATVLEKFPDISTHQASRILYDNNPEVWPTRNAARQAVKQARGANGNRGRHLATHPRPLVDPADLANPLGLPEAQEISYPIIDLEGSRFLVLSDIHIPYHDVPALTLALQEGKRFGADHVLLNGDLLDFHTISRYDADPGSRSLAEELRSCRSFLEVVRSEFPDAIVTWKKGNHCERWDKWLAAKAPELLDVPGMTPEAFMKLDDLGVVVYSDKLRLKAGKLILLHGHEFNGMSASVNPARGAYLKAAESVMVGHLHRTSQHSESSIMGQLTSCWSTGCLCQLHPNYARLNKWNHGYATVETDSSGAYQVSNYRIVDGKSWR